MRDNEGHHFRAGQIRVAFHDLAQPHERAELIQILRAPAPPDFIATVAGNDRQHYQWTAEALSGTWLIGYETGSPADLGSTAGALYELPGSGFPAVTPAVRVEALRFPFGTWDTMAWHREIGRSVIAVRRIALHRAGYTWQAIPDARPAAHAARAARDPVWDDRTPTPAAPVDPLADPGRRARYYGTRDTSAEPKPTRRQCGTCQGTGGDSVGAQCGSCRGSGSVAI